jgi:nucleotide-binding universal stress UspA family protein
MVRAILAALDGSEPAARGATLAADLAVRYGAALHLVHVINSPSVSRELMEFAELEGTDALEVKARAATQSFLADARAQAASKGVQRLATEVLLGDPAAKLLDYARERTIDLIVLGRRGMGPIRGLLMGSVSTKVNSMAACPVLTVP